MLPGTNDPGPFSNKILLMNFAILVINYPDGTQQTTIVPLSPNLLHDVYHLDTYDTTRA